MPKLIVKTLVFMITISGLNICWGGHFSQNHQNVSQFAAETSSTFLFSKGTSSSWFSIDFFLGGNLSLAMPKRPVQGLSTPILSPILSPTHYTPLQTSFPNESCVNPPKTHLSCSKPFELSSNPFELSFFQGNPSCSNNFIVPNKYVYYKGDTMELALSLPYFLTDFIADQTQTYLLIAPPEGDMIEEPVFVDAGKTWYNLHEIKELDTSQYALGDYQLGLVLTKPSGNPVNVNDWYQGFNGLISTTRLKILPEYQPESEDSDNDGIIDGDLDKDGFCEIFSTFHRRRGITFFIGKPACKKDLIFPNKHVYYQGDSMQIYLKFPDTLTSVIEGEADAYILVAPPEGDMIVMPVLIDDADELHPFFELADLDTSTFAKGNYQIALVLTEPGGNPIYLNDWYRDFRGLVSVTRVKISAGCDVEDIDGDGEIDGDTDGDGFSDETIPQEDETTTQEEVEEDETSQIEEEAEEEAVVEKPTSSTLQPQPPVEMTEPFEDLVDESIEESVNQEPPSVTENPVEEVIEKPVNQYPIITKPIAELIQEKPVNENGVKEPTEEPVNNQDEPPVEEAIEKPVNNDDSSITKPTEEPMNGNSVAQPIEESINEEPLEEEPWEEEPEAEEFEEENMEFFEGEEEFFENFFEEEFEEED